MPVKTALLALLVCMTVGAVCSDEANKREQQRQLWIQLNRNNNNNNVIENNGAAAVAKSNRKPPLAVALELGSGPPLRPANVLAPGPSPLELLVSNEERDPSPEPKPPATKQTRLQRLLGDNYDHEVMSVLRPVEASLRPNGSLSGRAIRDRPEMNMAVFETLRSRLQIGKKQSRKIEKLLSAYTECPLMHVWLDLGERFWPRWFREARCFQDRAKSCSIPAGMQCAPNDHVEKTILRYHCRNESNKKSKTCQWIPVKVSLITSCKCGCSATEDNMKL